MLCKFISLSLSFSLSLSLFHPSISLPLSLSFYNIPIFNSSSSPPPPQTYSMTGYSPFQGETHQETFLNVTMCDYDFDDEMFDVVSQEAKDFIEKLLIMAPRYSVCGRGWVGEREAKGGRERKCVCA